MRISSENCTAEYVGLECLDRLFQEIPPLEDPDFAISTYKTNGIAFFTKTPQEKKIDDDKNESKPIVLRTRSWYGSFDEKHALLSEVINLYEQAVENEKNPALKALYFCKIKELVMQRAQYDTSLTPNAERKKYLELKQHEIHACEVVADNCSDGVDAALWLLRAAQTERSSDDLLGYSLNSSSEENKALTQAAFRWKKAAEAFSALDEKQFNGCAGNIVLRLKSSLKFKFKEEAFESGSKDFVSAMCFYYAAMFLERGLLQSAEDGKVVWDNTADLTFYLFDKSIEKFETLFRVESDFYRKGLLCETTADLCQLKLLLARDKNDGQLLTRLKCDLVKKRKRAIYFYSAVDDKNIKGWVLLRKAINLGKIAFHSPLQERVVYYRKASETAQKIWERYQNITLDHPEFNAYYTTSTSTSLSEWKASLAGKLAKLYKHALEEEKVAKLISNID